MLSADVVEWLAGQGFANVFCEHLPEVPDAAIGVYTRAGRQPNANVEIEYSQIQILVRARADPRDGADVAQTVYNLLHKYAPNAALAAGGERVLLITAAQTPYHIGLDAKGRHEWSVNFSVTTQQE